jgi:uncharacterized protein
MSIQKNVQIVKDFFAAMGGSDRQGLLALCAEDIEWIIPGDDWPLAGTHRGHAGFGGFTSDGVQKYGNFIPKAPRIRSAGRQGSSRRFR